MENLAKIVHIKSLNNGYRFELCMCRSFINRRGGVTEVTYGFTAALGGEIHAHLASPRCLILLKKNHINFPFQIFKFEFCVKKSIQKDAAPSRGQFAVLFVYYNAI